MQNTFLVHAFCAAHRIDGPVGRAKVMLAVASIVV